MNHAHPSSSIGPSTLESPFVATFDVIPRTGNISLQGKRDMIKCEALMAALRRTTRFGNGVAIAPEAVLVDWGSGRSKAELALGIAKAIMEQFRVKEGESRFRGVLEDVS